MSTVYRTAKGVPYLKEPNAILIASTQVNLERVAPFLKGYDQSLGFDDYLKDRTWIPPGARIAKFAGQLCYMSFGPNRTKNCDADRYFGNIISQAHTSVFEHASFSFLIYGVSRSFTHEFVRHRHQSPSQQSQRYVGGPLLRFVERPEFQNDPELHEMFERRLDAVAEEYEAVTEILLKRQMQGDQILSAEHKTDLRKKVRQAARAGLTNDVEAPIVMTANVRAWREFLTKRATEHAEIEIRALAMKIYHELNECEPLLFQDFEVTELSDSTHGLRQITR